MPEDEDVALSQAIEKIKAFRWPVLAVMVLFAGAGVVYTIRKKPVYEAKTTLLLVAPDVSRSSLAQSLGVGATSPLSILQGVVKSRSALDYVEKKTGVPRTQLDLLIQVTTEPTENQITIGGSSPDKAEALKIVRSAIEALTVLNRDVGFTTAQKQVEFLEGAIATREKELKVAQNKLLAYQKTLSIPIDPTRPETAGLPLQQLSAAQFELGTVEKSLDVARKATAASASTLSKVPTNIPSINAWRQTLVRQEYELKNLQIQLGPDAPDVVFKRQQIENTKAALQRETKQYLQSVTSNVDPRLAELEARRLVLVDQIARLKPIAAKAPKQAIELARLYQETVGAGEALKTLREGYERARTEAQVDKVRWSVLDPPYLTDGPVNKSFVRNGAVGAIVGLFLGTVWAVRRRPR